MKIITSILLIICVKLLYLHGLSFVFNRFNVTVLDRKKSGRNILKPLFLFELFFIALHEEMFFRVLPAILSQAFLIICIQYGITLPFFAQNIIIANVAIMSSIVFGYAHGDYKNILIQGVGGMVYFVAFIMLGGMNLVSVASLENGASSKELIHFLSAILTIIFAHFSWNVMVIYGKAFHENDYEF